MSQTLNGILFFLCLNLNLNLFFNLLLLPKWIKKRADKIKW